MAGKIKKENYGNYTELYAECPVCGEDHRIYTDQSEVGIVTEGGVLIERTCPCCGVSATYLLKD